MSLGCEWEATVRATSGMCGGRVPRPAIRWTASVALVVAVTAGVFATTARADTPTSDGWKRLAERAISQGAPGGVRLVPGPVGPTMQLPPIPKEWLQLGIVERTFDPFRAGPNSVSPSFSQAFFDVPIAAAPTLARWHRSFLSLGWTEAPQVGRQAGLGTPAPTLRTYCRKNVQRTVIETLFDATVSVIVSGGGQCASATPEFPKEINSLRQAMSAPELAVPPTAIIVHQTIGKSSLLSDSAETTVETPKSVDELHAFAAKQMTALGWTTTETATAPSLVMSRWRKDVDRQEITAFLLVSTTPGPNRRTISITTWNKRFMTGLRFGGEAPALPLGPVTTKVP